MLRELGYYTGDDLNPAGDNLWFTLLFRRREMWPGSDGGDDFDRALRIFNDRMVGGSPPSAADRRWLTRLTENRPIDRGWLERRVATLSQAAHRDPGAPWGWKEPNTHVVLDRLNARLPGIRYIHVMRHGLDMAYSSNQNQLKLWGPVAFPGERISITPRWALRFWCVVHRRVEALAGAMPGRLLLLNYDAFCSSPRRGVRSLLEFLELSRAESAVASLVELVHAPRSIGRHRERSLVDFDADDVRYVESLGFDVAAVA